MLGIPASSGRWPPRSQFFFSERPDSIHACYHTRSIFCRLEKPILGGPFTIFLWVLLCMLLSPLALSTNSRGGGVNVCERVLIQTARYHMRSDCRRQFTGINPFPTCVSNRPATPSPYMILFFCCTPFMLGYSSATRDMRCSEHG